jgi:hypothetical protein
MDKIDVLAPGSRPKFEEWIAKRDGVAVWENVSLSGPLHGTTFTPRLDKDGKEYGSPHWSLGLKETIRDIARFRFAKAMREVRRLRIHLRMGSQGLIIKLTDHSSKRVRAAMDKAGKDAGYHFEGDEAVITVPEWEEGE